MTSRWENDPGRGEGGGVRGVRGTRVITSEDI